ncbi:leishmanolysin-related zinc metalloendopeptidase [Algoriphagus sp. AK58]|uniref:leishmanolysin-related zinc metalloendopeptidase n=1 Tax=Algoriphagus sp. AK58 TaxID=1406877 RepID=UPI001650C781
MKGQSEPIVINANISSKDEQGENFRATTAPGEDRGRFNITLKFITPVTERQNEVFTSAAARWERIIIGDIPSITGTLPSAFQGFPPVVQNGTIDDLIIEVAIAPIDGPGRILGQAGPRFLRTTGGLPVSGVMFFDVADLDFLEELDLFEDVIVHEMGHVLGVGTIWNSSGRTLREGPASNPFFNGKAANVHWNSFGGTGLLPIENVGGPGTAGGHWRESILRNELMTGFLNLGSNPLSRITAASMNDLGYRAAVVGERYELPLLNARVEGHEGEGINIGEMELLLEPIGYVVTENE